MVELKLSVPAIAEFTNKPRTGLQIRKVDALTGKPLEGVQFRVGEISGAVIGDLPHMVDLVGVSVLQNDFSFCVGRKLAQGLTILNADLKHHTLQRLESQ